jgi:hypothetical protein
MTKYAQAGSVGFRTQTAKGTYNTSAKMFARIRSGALSADRSLMIPDPEIGGNRDISDALLGPVAFKGTYSMYARMDSLAVLLKAALGDVSSSSSGTGTTLVGTHVITQVDDAALPWLSVEENIANDYEHYRYTDAKVNSLKLEAEATGYLMADVDMVALSQLAVPGASATSSPTFDTSPLTVGTNCSISFSGDEIPAKGFSFEVNNNLEDDDFRLGSLTLGDATEKRRTMQAGVKFRPDSNAMLRQALYGDPSAVTPQGTVVKDDVLITCETYEFIGETATVYSLTIASPQCVIKPFAPNPSGDDAIEHDIEIQFLRPDPLVDIITATVVNHQASVI